MQQYISIRLFTFGVLTFFLLACLANFSPVAAMQPAAAEESEKALESRVQVGDTTLLSARMDQLERKLELVAIKIRRLSEATDRLSREVAAWNAASPSSPRTTPLPDCNCSRLDQVAGQSRPYGKVSRSGYGLQTRIADLNSEPGPDAVRIRITAFGIEQNVVLCDTVKCWSEKL